MYIPLFVGLFAFLSSLIVIYLSAKMLIDAGNRYQTTFTDVAERNLSDMFVFIDPKKIYILNIVVILISFFVTWMIVGVIPVAIAVSVALGFAPKVIWKLLRTRREKRFLRDLPDAITSMSTMIKSGSNLSMVLEIVVAETPGPVGQEFGLFLNELKLGVGYYEALDNLQERMPLPELELVVAGMKISREVGGNLSDVLFRLADTIRRKIEMEGKIRALTAQGKAQGYVMTGLPIFLAAVLMKMEPVAMERLYTEIYGWATCVVFFVGLYIGYKFIKKIVTIDV